MTNRSEQETVDRSRLTLLGALSAAAATGACQSTDSAQDPLGRLTGTLGQPAEIRRMEKRNAAATKARADREEAEWQALAKRNRDYDAKRDRAVKRIKKYGNPADYGIETAGGEGGGSGGGGH